MGRDRLRAVIALVQGACALFGGRHVDGVVAVVMLIAGSLLVLLGIWLLLRSFRAQRAPPGDRPD